MALYQIHAFAELIADHYTDLTHDEESNNKLSDPLLTFVQIVSEKAEFCLNAIDKNN
jgi:hypothetical protein